MSEVQPDNNAAIGFLKRWSENGPWVLTAISIDKKSIETRTFSPVTEEALAEWLDIYNGKRNIYFHVNPVLKPLNKKANREDIKELAWLHVDIDPDGGKDLEAEQKHALGLLVDNLPETVPEPSVIIFSGGGYQGFWKLKDPLPINGDMQKAEQAKRYNQQLEVLFKADNCHNIDRIMRLPGSVNLPDRQKQKKGRVPALAKVIDFNEKIYSIGQFRPMPEMQTENERGFGAKDEPLQISGDVERLATIDDLDEWDVGDRLKIIAVQGRHPDEPKQGDNSRSAWVFDFCCNMIRKNVPEEVIYSVMTDPEFGISESILEMGSNAEKYALRQIARAKEEADDPWLRTLNDDYAVIKNIGGKTRIVQEVMDYALNRPTLTRISFQDFANSYCNHQIQVGVGQNGQPIMKEVGKFWIKHPQRRQYDRIVFAPGHDVKGAYNLWKGFACQAIPGDCGLFLSHLKENICANNEEHYNYLMGWMAKAVQQPDSPGEVAVVLRGGRGTGKSFFAKEFGKLFGRHFLQVSNSSHLTGNFNSHLRDLVVLFGDEAFYANDKKHASILKTLITEETLTIEAKGVDVETAPNYVHLIMASNDQHVIPAGGDERRFFVLDVGKAHQQDSKYFGAIAEQMDNGGREALLHTLLTLDIEKFQVRDVPMTNALAEQKLFSMSPEEEWWYQKLLEGSILENDDEWEEEIVKAQLVDDYIMNAKRFNISRRGSQTALGRFLSRIYPDLGSLQKNAQIEFLDGSGYTVVKEKRCWHYKLPPLDEARERWEELYGKQDWEEGI